MSGKRSFTRLVRLAFAGWICLLIALLPAAPASAHAGLVRSDPPDNSVLAEAPAEIRLWFSEPVSPEFSTARLLDVNGEEVPLASLRTDPADVYVLILIPEGLPQGVYSVNWKVLSEADGHFTQGLMVFGVGEGSKTGAFAKAAGAPKIAWLEVLLRWLNFASLAALFGGLAIARWVLPGSARDREIEGLAQARRRAESFGRSMMWVVMAIGFLLLVYQFGMLYTTLPEGASPLRVLWQLLGRTRWGSLWLVRQAVTAALLALPFIVPPVRLREGISLGLTASLLVVQAMSGHAAAVAPNTTLLIAGDALHLLAAAMWLGGLAGLAGAVLPGGRSSPAGFDSLLRSVWRPFGAWAALSVGLVIATGLYNTARQVASPDALLSTLYGRALIIKIGLMLVAGGAGLVSSISLHPALAGWVGSLLRQPAGWQPFAVTRLPRRVMLEGLVGLVIFLSVGLITSTPPARGPEYAPRTDPQLDSLSQSVDDLLVTFSAKPNVPGPNVFTIRATSRRRPAPAEILRMILRFTYQGQDLGTESADAELQSEGVYRLGGNYLSLAGPWQVDVVVRRNGIQDRVAHFEWNVPPGGPPRPVLISDKPWEGWLSRLSAAFFGGFLLIAILAALRRSRWTAAAILIVGLSLSPSGPGRSAKAAEGFGITSAHGSQNLELQTVLVTLKEQALLATPAGRVGAEEQRQVIERLQALAGRSQAGIRSLLDARQQQGSVTAYIPFWIFNGFSVTASASVIQELARRPEVARLEPEIQFYAPVVQLASGEPVPNLALIRAPDLWALGITGAGVVVGSLDTGVDASHPDLASRWRGGGNSWFDPYNQHPDTPADLNGHGTAVMGVMVGGDLSGKPIGVAPGARWVAVKIFNDRGTATATAIHLGYQWLLDPDGDPATADAPQVVNNSWVFLDPGCNLEFEPDLQALRAVGIIPVFSAGNFGPGSATSRSPANNPAALAVGATSESDQILPASSRGPSACAASQTYPHLVAPGENILSSGLAGSYTLSSGTSLSAPHASGGLALLLEAFPGAAPDMQQSALLSGAVDLGSTGPDNDYGNGRLDLYQAYQWLDEHYQPPVPTPTPTPAPTPPPVIRLYFPWIQG